MKGCSYARRKEGYDNWQCISSGDECVFWSPDAKRCAEEYGEGPLADAEAFEQHEGETL